MGAGIWLGCIGTLWSRAGLFRAGQVQHRMVGRRVAGGTLSGLNRWINAIVGVSPRWTVVATLVNRLV